jgi:hypothetical protein
MIAAAVIIAVTAAASMNAIASDALGFIAAAVLIGGAILLLVALYIADALVCSYRKVRDTDRFANPS